MAGTKYDAILPLTQSTLQKFLARDKFGIVNEMQPKTMLGGKLLRRCKKTMSGGKTLDFDLVLESLAPGSWVGANVKLELKGGKATVRGSVPWRFYQDGHFKDYKEIDLNKGVDVVIYDIMKQFKEAIALATIQEFEDTLISKDGNYNHDAAGTDFLKPLGLKYWGTAHGRHITNGSTKSVAGISPTTYSDWRNPFISPATSSDGLGAITHYRELPEAMERMAGEMYFESASPWGELAKDVKNAADYDPDGPQTPEDMLIVCDRRTNFKHRETLFDRRDDVTYKNQQRGRPTWHGIPVDWDTKLGLGANGYGKDDAGTALWTDGAAVSGYTVGNWVNGGEMYFINTKFFHIICHPEHMPYVKKVYEPEGMMGIAMEYDFWMQTLCRSRKRGIGCIVGYSTT